MHRTSSSLFAAAALVIGAVAAGAQATPESAHRRLQQALDAPTYRAVTLELDRARAAGVPVQPLVNRALQATLHRTPGARIRAAVTALGARLQVSKASLGPGSSDAEISAGAYALAAGVPPETLAEIRALSGDRPVTVPLGVLTELVAREVAVGRAARMVVALLRNGATASQLVSLSDDVKHDVDGGIAPGDAFDIRTRGVLGALEQAVGAETMRVGPAVPTATGGGTGPVPTTPRKP